MQAYTNACINAGYYIRLQDEQAQGLCLFWAPLQSQHTAQRLAHNQLPQRTAELVNCESPSPFTPHSQVLEKQQNVFLKNYFQIYEHVQKK